ncbi:enoyl-CoA hydratase/isomerase family protein [Mycobacterium sp. SMC-8]|uniref:enoyl-CoA hydratase-related protein n=1 Tax=Mycobacterium sp. SMC-8 TaxID=2857060 RepID=UPI0021B1C68E|nr:enoyl-CoA hydratase-related protein [Mycobacterium sp. SMC-8]UXA11546.1 enoyl-CoA hydratase/isomerase family protein [Mycobacterium sp. SMC-8]
MTTTHVQYQNQSGVAIVQLDRPDRLNAFTDHMEQQLIDAFDRADGDDGVRVVVLTGAGSAFCTGMDLKDSRDPGDAFVDWRSSPTAPPGTQFDVGTELPMRRDGGGRVSLRIFESTKPVIAAINGHAVGVGLTMTLPADIRVASANAKFALPFTRRALVPESCSSWFLPRVVPVQQAMEWMLTGRTFGADEALAGGLLRSVHPADEVLNAAMNIATEIAENTASVSTSMARRLLWQMMAAPHPSIAHHIETKALNLRGLSADAREGITAFVEKRKPVFTDRVTTDTPDVFPDPNVTPLWQNLFD